MGTDNRDCRHCGFPASPGHDCPESHPNPDLVDRLLEDHRDTGECEHGFLVFDGEPGCPNIVCLGRDLRKAADAITNAREVIRELIETAAAIRPLAEPARQSEVMRLSAMEQRDDPIAHKCRAFDEVVDRARAYLESVK